MATATGGMGSARSAEQMLEAARSQTQTKSRAQRQSYRWGIVDVLLGVLMLPFGLWLLVIEGMVRAVAAFRVER